MARKPNRIPLHWRKPRRIFVNSMSDLFHIFGADEGADTMADIPHNVHLYFSASTQKEMEEAWEYMEPIQVAVKGFSFEPLLEPIKLDLMEDSEVDKKCMACGHVGFADSPYSMCGSCGWAEYELVDAYNGDIGHIIIGCESGPKERPCKLEWVRDIISQCREAEVPCYIKQVEINGKANHNPNEWPEDLRIREMPKGNSTES